MFRARCLYLVAAVKEQDELYVCLVLHDPAPALQVVLVAWEAVDEKAVLLLICLHGLLHGLREESIQRGVQH